MAFVFFLSDTFNLHVFLQRPHMNKFILSDVILWFEKSEDWSFFPFLPYRDLLRSEMGDYYYAPKWEISFTLLTDPPLANSKVAVMGLFKINSLILIILWWLINNSCTGQSIGIKQKKENTKTKDTDFRN